jgi:electron transfer flavoprotein alpha subunit
MIAVFMETRDGKIKKSSLEALSEARRRAGELRVGTAAVLVGAAGGGTVGLEACGPDKIFCLEHPALAAYSSQGFAKALRDFVGETGPAALFFAATAMGRDLAPRVAAGLGAGLASDCTKVAVKNGGLEFTRPVYAGKAYLSFTVRSTPVLATLRPNVFPLDAPPSGGAPEIVRKSVDIPDGLIKGRVAEVLKEESSELDVTEADVVISGGRGLKGPENFGLLRDLAALIPRAAVGASRSAVDSGWIGHQHQVGQTGKTVSPNLYLAVGISGAIQHLAGMSSSKVIAAVNKDPEAPILKVADYGVVGDLFEVIPRLKEELKKVLAE